MQLKATLLKLIFVLCFVSPFGLVYGQNVDGLIKKADENIKTGDWKSAIDNYTKAIVLEPNNEWAYLNRGFAYKALEQYDLAIADYDMVLSLNAKNFDALSNRALAYSAKKEFELAKKDFKQALSLQPKNTFVYCSRAQMYLEEGNIEAAIQDCSKAINIDPQYSFAFATRGHAYRQKMDYARAIKDFSTFIALEPNDFWGYHDRGIVNYESDEYDAAIDDLTAAIAIDSKVATAYEWRAFAFESVNQFDLAIENFSTAIKLTPEAPHNYNNRALVYNQLGAYEKALNDLKTNLSLMPDDGIANINIIAPLARLGRFKEANGYYQQYVQKGLNSFLENSSYDFYKSYIDAIGFVAEEKYDDAFASLDKAYTQYGDELKKETKRAFIDVMALYGYLLEKTGAQDHAKTLYEQSLVIDANQPDIKQALDRISSKEAIAANSDKTPPEISLISPVPEGTVDVANGSSKIQVVGKAKDAAGISVVKMNNATIEKVEEDGLFIASFTLKPGNNILNIVATDSKGNTATKTFTIVGVESNETRGGVVENTAAPKLALVSEQPPKYYAILIAEEQYEDPGIPDLQNPVKDAAALGKILESQYNFDAANIDTLYNRSREDIMASIVKRANLLTENDNLIIFYAGHGFAEKDKFGDVDGYWIPTSARKNLTASYISTEDINKAIKRSNAKHILVIADACFSGALTRALPPDATKEISKQYTVSSRKVMASGNLEPVPDNSKFIFYLKERLSSNKEKYLTAKELFDSFYKAVLSNSDNVPQYAAIKNVGGQGGEFVFIKK